MSEEHVATVRKSLNDEVLPRHLQFFENILSQSPSGWFAGGPEPSIADFVLVPRLMWLVEPGVHDGISTDILKGYPHILALIDKLMNLPQIKAYYESKK